MSFRILKIALLALLVFPNCSNGQGSKHEMESTLKEGDIVFQTTSSRQCKAVQQATHSPFSHCGMILKHNGLLMVYEAVGPVKWTTINDWTSHGVGGKYSVKRLKDTALLDEAHLATMRKAAEAYKGLPYDIYFGWSNESIYCSELVWKVYADALHIELSQPQKLKEFDLTSREVKTIMAERYGSAIPYEEPAVSPAALFDSKLLKTVEAP